ncbi:DUF3099 domain-containing protein [Streptomyces sp. NPDC005865]|uniref:DUF3099 domain-containing protein n=1 Tax=Streptomyces sp. NPDC005865 TaxID=3155453 RepID=UPI003405BF94
MVLMHRPPGHRDHPRPALTPAPAPPPGPGPGSLTAGTAARTGLTQELRGRQRRYVGAMLVRTACVVLMALTWNRWPALAVCALIGGVAIPYVAVVAAQAGWRQQRGGGPPWPRCPRTAPRAPPSNPPSSCPPHTTPHPDPPVAPQPPSTPRICRGVGEGGCRACPAPAGAGAPAVHLASAPRTPPLGVTHVTSKGSWCGARPVSLFLQTSPARKRKAPPFAERGASAAGELSRARDTARKSAQETARRSQGPLTLPLFFRTPAAAAARGNPPRCPASSRGPPVCRRAGHRPPGPPRPASFFRAPARRRP